jgi:hypothetical protein
MLKKIVDSYMQKFPGLKEHCKRCLRTERWGESIGLNYFTTVVPRVEEFNKKFVENGRIENLGDLAKADINELRTCD